MVVVEGFWVNSLIFVFCEVNDIVMVNVVVEYMDVFMVGKKV